MKQYSGWSLYRFRLQQNTTADSTLHFFFGLLDMTPIHFSHTNEEGKNITAQEILLDHEVTLEGQDMKYSFLFYLKKISEKELKYHLHINPPHRTTGARVT